MPLRATLTAATIVAALTAASVTPTRAQTPGDTSDPRIAVPLPAAVAEALRAEMRGHMRSLDDILYALSEGDYDEAADIAVVHWDFAHRMWEAMEDQGMSPEEIAARKAAMRDAMTAAGMEPGSGQGPGGGMGQGMGQGMGMGRGGGMAMGPGPGRFMPENFRMMGQSFHAAGQRFAEQARAMGESPDAAEVTALMGSLQEVTAVCRSCHDTFRLIIEDGS
ncbi:cytochrome c [Roseospira navarrensis]|nr:cytochrome c [Roseospira navarrensis]